MKNHLIALGERVSSTFIFAALGVIVAHGSGIDLLSLKAAGIAGGLSVAKYLYTLAGAYLAKPDPLLTSNGVEAAAVIEHIDAVAAAIKAATPAPAPPPPPPATAT